MKALALLITVCFVADDADRVAVLKWLDGKEVSEKYADPGLVSVTRVDAENIRGAFPGRSFFDLRGPSGRKLVMVTAGSKVEPMSKRDLETLVSNVAAKSMDVNDKDNKTIKQLFLAALRLAEVFYSEPDDVVTQGELGYGGTTNGDGIFFCESTFVRDGAKKAIRISAAFLVDRTRKNLGPPVLITLTRER